MRTGISIQRLDGQCVAMARQALSEVQERGVVASDSLRIFLAGANNYLLAAITDSGQAVGVLRGYHLEQPHSSHPQFLLYDIDVQQNYRRQGIGRRLVEAFCEAARESDAEEIWVLTNTANLAAMRLYQTCGFTRAHDDDAMFYLPLS